MIFKTAKVQENEADREIIRSLTSRIDEQNDTVDQITREAAK